MTTRSLCTSECVVAICLGVVTASLLGLLQWNRYSGVCGSFNDSTGTYQGEFEGRHYECFDDSNSKSSIGSTSGPLNLSRSRAYWILQCIVFATATVTTLATLLYRIRKRRKAEREDEGLPVAQLPASCQVSTNDSSGVDFYRICWIIFVCAAVVVLLCLLEFAKCVLCHRSGLEMTCNVFFAASFVSQGSQLMFEVRYGLERGQLLQSKSLRAFFVYMSIYNFILWCNAIVHSICHNDKDNGLIIGQHVWPLVRAIPRTSIAFYRILSSCIYLTLALRASGKLKANADAISRQDSCLNTFQSRMTSILTILCKVASADMAYTVRLRKRPPTRRITDQTVRCVRRSGVIRYSYHTLTFGQIRLIDNILICSFPGIFLIVLPPFLYGFLIRTAGGHQPSENTYIVELVLSCVILGLTYFCLVVIPDYSLTSADNLSSVQRKLSWLLNPEALALLVFGVISVLFFVISGTFFIIFSRDAQSAGGRAASSFVCSLTCLSQLVLILLVKFRNRVHRSLARRYSNWLGSALALLFATSVSYLIVTIQKEEFDPLIHDWKTLHSLIPMVVDFRVHVVILTYSMLVDFVEHRYRKGVDMDAVPVPSSCRLQFRCGIPGCNNLASHDVGRCSRTDCGRGYCSVCFDNILSQLGSCICTLDERCHDGLNDYISDDEIED